MGLKKNFCYSSILTLANYIFPLLTFPYVSRVLGVDAIGKYNFVDNIIQIFFVISMLGVGIVGVREIAQHKGNKEELAKYISALLFLNLGTTFIALLTLITCIFIVPKFSDYQTLLAIGCFKLLFSSLLIDWFFRGIEDFEYITKRTLIIRIAFVASVFLFIKEQSDYNLYYFLITISIVINAIVNMVYAHKYTRFTLDFKIVRRLIKPILILGGYSILAWLYNSFSTAYLGFVTNDTEVGYYSVATKLYNIFLSILSAFTAVMLPRLSQFIHDSKHDEFQRLLQKSFNLVFTVAIPVMAFSIIYADDIISIIAGAGYEKASISMRIIMPLVLIVGLEQILIIQILMPLAKEKEVIINTIWGAVVGISLNLLLTTSLFSIGAAISWLMAEITVMISAFYFIRTRTSFKFSFISYKQISTLAIWSFASIYICHILFYEFGLVPRIILSALVFFCLIYIEEKFYARNAIIAEITIAVLRILHIKKRY